MTTTKPSRSGSSTHEYSKAPSPLRSAGALQKSRPTTKNSALRALNFWSAVVSGAGHRFGFFSFSAEILMSFTRVQSKAPSPLRSAGALQKSRPTTKNSALRALNFWSAVVSGARHRFGFFSFQRRDPYEFHSSAIQSAVAAPLCRPLQITFL